MAGKNIAALVVRFETRFHRRKNVSGGELCRAKQVKAPGKGVQAQGRGSRPSVKEK